MQRNRREHSQCFPCPLRHQGACWTPGPNPLLSEPPSCWAEPTARPYTPTQRPTSTLGDTLQHTGPKPHPHTLTQGPNSKLQNPTLQRPSFPSAASPLLQRSSQVAIFLKCATGDFDVNPRLGSMVFIGFYSLHNNVKRIQCSGFT